MILREDIMLMVNKNPKNMGIRLFNGEGKYEKG